MDAELLLEGDLQVEAGAVGIGGLRARGRRTARTAAPPPGRSARGPLSRRRRPARRGCGSRPCRVAHGRRGGPSPGPASARRRRARRRRRRPGRATGCVRPAGPPRPRSWSGCRPAGRSRHPRRRRCRRGGASSGASRARGLRARGSASRRDGPTRRSRRRPCPPRSGERRSGRYARSGEKRSRWGDEFFNLTPVPRLLRAGARRGWTDGARNYRWATTRHRPGSDGDPVRFSQIAKARALALSRHAAALLSAW